MSATASLITLAEGDPRAPGPPRSRLTLERAPGLPSRLTDRRRSSRPPLPRRRASARRARRRRRRFVAAPRRDVFVRPGADGARDAVRDMRSGFLGVLARLQRSRANGSLRLQRWRRDRRASPRNNEPTRRDPGEGKARSMTIPTPRDRRWRFRRAVCSQRAWSEDPPSGVCLLGRSAPDAADSRAGRFRAPMAPSALFEPLAAGLNGSRGYQPAAGAGRSSSVNAMRSAAPRPRLGRPLGPALAAGGGRLCRCDGLVTGARCCHEGSSKARQRRLGAPAHGTAGPLASPICDLQLPLDGRTIDAAVPRPGFPRSSNDFNGGAGRRGRLPPTEACTEAQAQRTIWSRSASARTRGSHCQCAAALRVCFAGTRAVGVEMERRRRVIEVRLNAPCNSSVSVISGRPKRCCWDPPATLMCSASIAGQHLVQHRIVPLVDAPEVEPQPARSTSTTSSTGASLAGPRSWHADGRHRRLLAGTTPPTARTGPGPSPPNPCRGGRACRAAPPPSCPSPTSSSASIVHGRDKLTTAPCTGATGTPLRHRAQEPNRAAASGNPDARRPALIDPRSCPIRKRRPTHWCAFQHHAAHPLNTPPSRPSRPEPLPRDLADGDRAGIEAINPRTRRRHLSPGPGTCRMGGEFGRRHCLACAV